MPGSDAAPHFRKELKAAGLWGEVDVVFDPVGGAWSEVALRALRFAGRFIVVGFAAGGSRPNAAIPRVPLNQVHFRVLAVESRCSARGFFGVRTRGRR